MLRLLVTLLSLSSFCSAQEADSAASAAGPQPALDLPVWSAKLAQPNRYISGVFLYSSYLDISSGSRCPKLPLLATASWISTGIQRTGISL